MTSFWQDLVIVMAVGAALVHLIHRVIGWRRRRRACAECRLMQAVTGKDRNRSDPAPLD